MKKYLLLCQYFVKKRPHSKTQTAIQFFYNKFPTIMLIFHQKMLILLKLYNVLGHQGQKNAFFLSFTKKSTSHAYILSKIRLISKKNTLLSSPYIIMKTSILSKTLCFYVIFFFKYRMEYPWPLSPFLVKKRQFCQNNSTFWVHKVNKIPLFSDVFRKNQRSHAHILSNKLSVL